MRTSTARACGHAAISFMFQEQLDIVNIVPQPFRTRSKESTGAGRAVQMPGSEAAQAQPRMACLEEIVYRQGGPLRLLARPVRVCEPCVGIGGLRRLVLMCGGLYNATAAYDVDADLGHFYASLQKHEVGAAAEGLSSVHTGPVEGDLLKVPLEEVESCELLAAGPPCQPWSSSGEKGGCNDPRAEVMDRTVNLIIEQAWQGQLSVAVLENSSRLLATEYAEEILRRLQAAVPFFQWELRKSDLSHIFPHSRERMWLRGMRRDALLTDELPEPLEAESLGSWVPLDSLLDETPQPLNPIKLSKMQQCNLVAYQELVQMDAERGLAGRIALFELDRSPLKSFGGSIMYDRCMALRTSGPKVFMLLTAEAKKPWQEHTLHRFLSTEERCRLQGHDGSLALHFRTKVAALRGTGNAFHPLHLGSMLLPMIRQAFLTGVLNPDKPKNLSHAELLALSPPAGFPKLPSSASEPEGAGGVFDELFSDGETFEAYVARAASPRSSKQPAKENSSKRIVSEPPATCVGEALPHSLCLREPSSGSSDAASEVACASDLAASSGADARSGCSWNAGCLRKRTATVPVIDIATPQKVARRRLPELL